MTRRTVAQAVVRFLAAQRSERDGAEPYGGVTLDAQGNVYGTAVTGGAGSCESSTGCWLMPARAAAGWSWCAARRGPDSSRAGPT